MPPLGGINPPLQPQTGPLPMARCRASPWPSRIGEIQTLQAEDARKAEPMRWSQMFIPTLREIPAEAEVPSHQLLLRAGYIRQVSAGLYAHLYLAQRSFLKIIQIVREEMNRIGGQEFDLPVLNPGELWKESGRSNIDVMFKLKDRSQHEMCLG